MCLHVSGVKETEREGGVKVASELGGGGVYWLYRLCIIDDERERERERELDRRDVERAGHARLFPIHFQTSEDQGTQQPTATPKLSHYMHVRREGERKRWGRKGGRELKECKIE